MGVYAIGLQHHGFIVYRQRTSKTHKFIIIIQNPQLAFIILMSFLTRQNRQPQPQSQQPPNRGYGRGKQTQVDQSQADRKLQQQQRYKLQLQQQIKQKQDRKKMQQEKIRKQDEKFMREIQEQNRKDNQLKRLEKEKLRKLQQSVQAQSPSNKKDNNPKDQKPSRVIAGTLNVSLRQPTQNTQPNQLPRLGLNSMYNQPENINSYSAERIRPYLYQQNQQINTYYQQRLRKHKEQMNMKIDQLFHHINSTKDNIRADQEIEKIKRKLRAKQISYSNNQSGVGIGESRAELDYENKFFHIPKKNNQVYKNENYGRSKVLDYQSKSKFTVYNNNNNNKIEDSRTKSRAKIDDMYNLPDNSNNNYSNDRQQKWGNRPGKDNYLSNREAIDFEAQSILGRIDDFLDKLKN